VPEAEKLPGMVVEGWNAPAERGHREGATVRQEQEGGGEAPHVASC